MRRSRPGAVLALAVRGADPVGRGLRVPGRAGEHARACGSRPRRCRPRWSPRRAPGRSRSWAGRPRRRTTSGSCSSGPRAPPAGRWSPRRAWPTTAGWSRRPARAARSLLVGFRPSQALAFSPLATSSDTGQNWTPGLLDADLADVPDAMAVAPSGQTLALLHDGSIEAAATAAAATAGQWSRLTTLSALAASAPGRGCGLVAVNAVSFGPDNVPMAAGSCVRRGVAGVFADTGGTWQAAGPVLPAGFGGDQVQVLGLARTAAATRRCCWPGPTCWRPGRTGRAGRSRRRSRPGDVSASGFGPGGSVWVLLGGGPGGDHRRARGILAGAAGPCRRAPRRSRRGRGPGTTRWPCRAPGSPSGSSTAAAWTKVQVINVPILYGSSG